MWDRFRLGNFLVCGLLFTPGVLAGALWGAELQLEFPAPKCEDPDAKLVLLSPKGKRLGPDLAAPLPAPLRLSQLEAGTQLLVRSSRCFVPPITLGVEVPTGFRLPVDPLAFVQFRLEKTRPTEVRFAAADSFRWGSDPFPFSAWCEETGEQVRCEVPAKAIHLKISGERGAPHYLWGLKLTAGETRSLGSLPLRLGGSLAGWVEPAPGERLPRGLKVKATLAGRQPASLFGRPRVVPPQLEAASELGAEGFFQLVGLSPGAYHLEVSGPGRSVSLASELFVQKDREVLLKNPMVLHWPRILRAVVEPPLDPEGRSWTVELHQRLPLPEDPRRYFLEPWMSQAADGSGEARFQNLPPGAYALVVLAGEEVVLEEPVEVPEESAFEETVSLRVDPVAVSGRWRCRGEPLKGSVGIQSAYRDTPVRRTVPLDEEGGFSSWMSRGEGRVSFSFEGSSPKFRLGPVATRRVGPGVQALEVDLDLPGARVSGRVVGSHGEPRPEVKVRFLQSLVFEPQAEGLASSATDSGPGGEFELPCLLPGKWKVWAEDRKNGEKSRPILLELLPEGELSDLTLRLEKLEILEVELRRGGAPVQGEGTCLPRGEELWAGGVPAKSFQPSGLLRFELPPGPVTCLFWDSASVVVRELEVKAGRVRPELVALASPEQTGTLRLRLSQGEGRRFPRWLLRDGVPISLELLWAGPSRSTGSEEVPYEIVGFEAGVYQLCSVFSGCVPWTLTPGSSATVEIHEVQR
jgi:hypothetical protein